MPATYVQIASNILSVATSSVVFSSIPNTYTDLVLKMSVRGDAAAVVAAANVTINGSTSTYSVTNLRVNSSGTVESNRLSAQAQLDYNIVNGGTSTASTFSSNEIYIPSYNSTINHPLSIATVTESNAATGPQIGAVAGLWSTANAITSITLTASSGNFVAGSSFFLYGIKNS